MAMLLHRCPSLHSGFMSRGSLARSRVLPPVQQQHQQRPQLQLHSLPPDSNFYGSQEKVLSLSDLLKECAELDDDLLMEDDDEDLPVWEHEGKLKYAPLTAQELAELRQEEEQQQQQQQAALFPDPLEAVSQAVSAYSAESGFREMSVEELSVALTAGGLIDLLLDVRSQEEFEAGPSIPTAVNIPLDSLSDAVRSGRLDPYMARSVVVVCASGQRSAQATVRLSKVFQFQHVSNVAGGMAAWQRLRQGSGGGGCGCGGGGGGCSK